jgi:hypothetical protein
VRIVRAAMLYFALVFGVGFVLGFVRVLWVAPRLGERVAELAEAPIMVLVTVLAARAVVRRLAAPSTAGQRLAIGLVALGALLVAECAGVLWLRGLTLQEYVTARDPLATTVYAVSLLLFGLMPLLAAPRPGRAGAGQD